MKHRSYCIRSIFVNFQDNIQLALKIFFIKPSRIFFWQQLPHENIIHKWWIGSKLFKTSRKLKRRFWSVISSVKNLMKVYFSWVNSALEFNWKVFFYLNKQSQKKQLPDLWEQGTSRLYTDKNSNIITNSKTKASIAIINPQLREKEIFTLLLWR